MSATGTRLFDKTLQKSNEWLNEICEYDPNLSKEDALTCLRAVLHVLRDRLPIDEAAHLSSQLPLLIRGMYYENWDPACRALSVDNKDTFLSEVRGQYQAHDMMNVDRATQAVFCLLENHVDQGELRDVKLALPRKLREYWESACATRGQDERRSA